MVRNKRQCDYLSHANSENAMLVKYLVGGGGGGGGGGLVKFTQH